MTKIICLGRASSANYKMMYKITAIKGVCLVCPWFHQSIVVTHFRGLITLLITTHEPPSRGSLRDEALNLTPQCPVQCHFSTLDGAHDTAANHRGSILGGGSTTESNGLMPGHECLVYGCGGDIIV